MMVIQTMDRPQMKLDYAAPEHHVTLRVGLPPAIRKTLLESTRTEWEGHPRFGGKAAFFMNIHRDLLRGTAGLSTGLKQLMDVPEGDLAEASKAMRLRPYARQLISFAHHHHEIEDHGYFPQFALLYPGLDRALALLDGDHKALDAALDETGTAINGLGSGDLTRDHIAALHSGADALEHILNRHIWDEEEIIIPIFLRHT